MGKREREDNIFLVIVLAILFCTIIYAVISKPNGSYGNTVNKIGMNFYSDKAKSLISYDIVLAEIKRQEIKHPEIVLRQAILETGWFKSNVFKQKNNLFGMTKYENGKRVYQDYSHWKYSIIAYKRWQDKYYTKGDYYSFLECIYEGRSGCKRYATDPEYIKKLQNIRL